MPYIVNSAISGINTPAVDFTAAIPDGHAANDLLIAVVTQDGGGAVITGSSGWTCIETTQAQVYAQRTSIFWKIATSNVEAPAVFSGANDEWVTTIIVIRNANVTTPINAYNRADSASNVNYLDCGSVITTEDNCLVLFAWGFDSPSAYLMDSEPSGLTFIGTLKTLCSQLVGYNNQQAAGSTPIRRAMCNSDLEGGAAFVVAISDANPSTAHLSPSVISSYDVFRFYAAGTAMDSGVTLGSVAILSATTINGDPVESLSLAIVSTQGVGTNGYSFTRIAVSGAEASPTGAWVGAAESFASENFYGKVLSLEFFMGLTFIGDDGACIVLEDTSGAWVAYQIIDKYNLENNVPRRRFIELGIETPLDSFGDINYTDIVKIGYLYNRVGQVTNTVIMPIRHVFLSNKLVVTDGCEQSPVTAAFVSKMFSSRYEHELSGTQGNQQALIKGAVQIGDGTRPTYADFSGGSYELPANRMYWRVGANSPNASFTILASSNDLIKITACIMATSISEDWIIDDNSSPLAAYDFSGLVLIGWRVKNNVTGITFNNTTFRNTRGITLNGGALTSCSIKNSATSPAVTTDDPSNISNCTFVSTGNGHAIEITSAGTYNFNENTFSGYGDDDTTDAAIYNNSGGSVILQLLSTDQIPTVLNSSGSTTSFELAPVSVTLQNVQSGSRYRVYNITTDTTLATGEQSGSGDIVINGIPYNGSNETLKIDVRKSSSAPFYKPFSTNAILGANGASVYVSQELDTIAGG